MNGTQCSLPTHAFRLRIFTGDKDKFQGKPLYEAVVNKAREAGLAGATVLRGLSGFGANSRVHTATILRLSEDLPLIIEVVDEEEKIKNFLPVLDEMMVEGLVTMEPVKVVMYRHNEGRKR